MSARTQLSADQLLDLFKHWDSRVSHQELLNVTLAGAAIGAAAAGWDKIDSLAVLALAVGSEGIYLFNLLAIRRLALFQDNIFRKLREQHFCDWEEVVFVGNRRLGIRKLRHYGVPLLACIWGVMLYAKLGCVIPTGWEFGFIAFIAVPLCVFMWLVLDAQ